MKGRAAESTDTTVATFKGKIVIIGEYSVGKTSLCQRFINRVSGKTEPTIGAAFQVKTVTLPNSSQTVKLEIWDTAGSERYRSLMPMYYRDSSAAMICYDITNAKSFERVASWVEDFRRHAMQGGSSGIGAEQPNSNRVFNTPQAGGGASSSGGAPMPILVLVGTKADLGNPAQETKRQVDTELAARFAQREDMTFFETSAKMDINVREAFMAVAVHISKLGKPDGSSIGGSAGRNSGGGQGGGSRKVDLRANSANDDEGDAMYDPNRKKCAC